MTLSELKAWLEGYSASFTDGAPSAEQWAEIQKRINAARPLNLGFAPYGPRPDDTMTKPLEFIRPYYVGDPLPSTPTPYRQAPIVTCSVAGEA